MTEKLAKNSTIVDRSTGLICCIWTLTIKLTIAFVIITSTHIQTAETHITVLTTIFSFQIGLYLRTFFLYRPDAWRPNENRLNNCLLSWKAVSHIGSNASSQWGLLARCCKFTIRTWVTGVSAVGRDSVIQCTKCSEVQCIVVLWRTRVTLPVNSGS